MSAFSASTYASEAYKAFRPTYSSSSLLALLKGYHKGALGCAVDIGCGTGQATIPLSTVFQRVIGIDPSANMISSARQTPGLPSNVSFVSGSDTEFSELSTELNGTKVDMFMGAQTAHWWDVPGFLKAARGIANPKATVALLGYTLVNSRKSDKVTELLRDTAYGDSKLGPYWEPGRQELEGEYQGIEAQLRSNGVKNIQRIEFLGRTVKRISKEGAFGKPECFVELDMNLVSLRNYLGTWSSYNTWKKENPGLVGGEKDLVVRLISEVKKELGGEGKRDEEVEVELDWPHFLICGEL